MRKRVQALLHFVLIEVKKNKVNTWRGLRLYFAEVALWYIA